MAGQMKRKGKKGKVKTVEVKWKGGKGRYTEQSPPPLPLPNQKPNYLEPCK